MPILATSREPLGLGEEHVVIAAVAVPYLISGAVNTKLDELLFSCSFVMVIIAVIPWGYIWKQYAKTTGDPWRWPRVSSEHPSH